MIVYLINEYGEHGPEDLAATLSRAEIPALVRKVAGPDVRADYLTEALVSLYTLLASHPEGDEFSANLHNGWGGMQIHAVRLQP